MKKRQKHTKEKKLQRVLITIAVCMVVSLSALCMYTWAYFYQSIEYIGGSIKTAEEFDPEAIEEEEVAMLMSKMPASPSQASYEDAEGADPDAAAASPSDAEYE